MSTAARWKLVLAVLAVLALLLAFERVVRQGVMDGALRKAAVLERSNAAWRCNLLPRQEARANCRQGLT